MLDLCYSSFDSIESHEFYFIPKISIYFYKLTTTMLENTERVNGPENSGGMSMTKKRLRHHLSKLSCYNYQLNSFLSRNNVQFLLMTSSEAVIYMT